MTARVRRWLDERRARRELLILSDVMLKDLAMDRSEIVSIVRHGQADRRVGRHDEVMRRCRALVTSAGERPVDAAAAPCCRRVGGAIAHELPFDRSCPGNAQRPGGRLRRHGALARRPRQNLDFLRKILIAGGESTQLMRIGERPFRLLAGPLDQRAQQPDVQHIRLVGDRRAPGLEFRTAGQATGPRGTARQNCAAQLSSTVSGQAFRSSCVSPRMLA